MKDIRYKGCINVGEGGSASPLYFDLGPTPHKILRLDVGKTKHKHQETKCFVLLLKLSKTPFKLFVLRQAQI